MAIEVKLFGYNVGQILEVVKELKSMGYQQQTDFNFRWHPPVNVFFANESPGYATFTFYNEEIAIWFKLKYD